MAKKTVAQLITDFRALVEDSEIASSTVMSWFNEAIYDLSDAALKESTVSLNIVSGTDTYDQPTDLLMPILLVVGSAKALSPLPLDDFTSEGFKLWGGKIILQPKPAENTTGTLYYYALFAAITSVNDIPEVDEHFQHLLVDYAVGRYQYKEEELDLNHAVFQKYQAGKVLYKLRRGLITKFSKPKGWAVVRRRHA